MYFENALVELKMGKAMRRSSWPPYEKHRKYVGLSFIVLMPGMELAPLNDQNKERRVNDRTAKWVGKNTALSIQPYFASYRHDGVWQPGWVPSNEDLFASDWVSAEDLLPK